MTYGTVQANAIQGSINTFSPNSAVFRNRIINGGFNVAQRGTSFVSGANDDDTYNLDRWYVLSDGNDAVDITQTTTVPTNAKYSIGLDVETANKKFGIAQIIENVNCYDIIGQTVTLSFQAKVSATTKLDNVKCAIVAWSGTADSVTSDIISAWGAEDTNPTLITNATYENTPANLNVTTSFASYSVSATIDTANTTNVIAFIWSDVTDTTTGDFLYVTNVQLEVGSTATSFDYRSYGTELALCQRYYFDVGGQAFSVASIGGNAYTTTWCYGLVRSPVTMRAMPTFTKVGNWNWSDYDTINTDTGALTFSSNNSTLTLNSFWVASHGTSSGLTANRPYSLSAANSATARLQFNAEL
jgi:hypothetical protein